MSRLFLKKRLKKVLETNNMIKESWKIRKEEKATEKKSKNMGNYNKLPFC